jgi:hypothetical protein
MNEIRYTKDDLAEMLGVQKKHISAWCSPSKRTIILDEDGLIDLSIEKNSKFVKRKMAEKLMPDESREKFKGKRVARKAEAQKQEKAESTPESNKPKPKEPTPKVVVDYRTEQEKRKDELQIQKLEKENRLRQLEIERKEGNLMDATEAMVKIRKWSMFKDEELLKAIENKIKYICSRESIPNDRSGKYLAEIPQIINQCSEEANNRLKEEFDE